MWDFSRLAKVMARLIPAAVATLAVMLVVAAARVPEVGLPELSEAIIPHDDVLSISAEVDRLFQATWDEQGIQPAPPAEDLQVLRRLSLALHGSIPSLEEIRRFESDRAPDRLDRWAQQMVADRRFADYFAVRLSRAFVGAEGGQFILFRRDRFRQWLADQLHADRPMDEIVREMIASNGLWTGVPATNFTTQALSDGNLDHNKLAGRTVRAFLGQRIDCAQCHDHPFAHWKQSEFEGLAACFGQTRVSVAGIGNDPSRVYEIVDRETQETETPTAGVPFGSEWWPAEGPYRDRLAAWVTHPENVRFERAMVNRTWGLMYGRAYSEPVDDLADPPEADEPLDLLGLLGREFRSHNCRLKPLILAIAGSRAFRMSSVPADTNTDLDPQFVEDFWGVFPLIRLRPEQMIGAMCQAASIKTINQNSHLLVRFLRFVREQDFVREYGDFGELELEDRSGTIPQALLRMNGRFTREVGEASPLTSSGRIAGMCPTDDSAIEIAYLCCLTRYPTAEELEVFREGRDDSRSRGDMVEDAVWALFNSPEFCWNH